MNKILTIIETIIGSITVDSFKKLLYKDTKAAFFAVFKDTGKKHGFGTIRPDPQAIKDMENRSIVLSQATTDRLKGNLRYELLEGMNAGESVDKISERLKTVFKGDEVNTERIARNEVLISSKNGRYEAYKEGGAWGTEWVCTDDDRTSDICRRMDGETRKIGEPFVDPKTGDKFDIAHGHIQCRCSEKILFEDPDADEPVEKKLVQVKASHGRVAHTRNIKPGAASREGTSKIESLPESIKAEILELRRTGFSGEKIKANLESSIGSLSQSQKDKLVAQGVISETSQLKLSAPGITAWAKTRGAESPKKRESKTTGAEAKTQITESQLKESQARNEQLAGEIGKLKDELKDVDAVRKENVRHRDEKAKLRNEVELLRAELKRVKS